MSGNKGAVSIRLDYHDTSFCFITAHLAAGHPNIDERNADYWTIVNGLHFLRGKTIESHECVYLPRFVDASPFAQFHAAAPLSG
jgi:synaptojanin